MNPSFNHLRYTAIKTFKIFIIQTPPFRILQRYHDKLLKDCDPVERKTKTLQPIIAAALNTSWQSATQGLKNRLQNSRNAITRSLGLSLQLRFLVFPPPPIIYVHDNYMSTRLLIGFRIIPALGRVITITGPSAQAWPG